MHLILLVLKTDMYFFHNLPELSLKVNEDYTNNQLFTASFLQLRIHR